MSTTTLAHGDLLPRPGERLGLGAALALLAHAGLIGALALGLIHDVRFLRDSHAADRAQASWSRLLKTYQP